MKKDYAKQMMNPIKLRIMQQIAANGEADAKQLAAQMPEVPQSSLYRHLNELTELGILQIVSETRMRGTVKKTYGMRSDFAKEAPNQKECAAFVRFGLSQIAAEFQQYFEQEEIALQEDCVELSNMIVHVTKEEYRTMMGEIQQILQRYGAQTKEADRLTRRIAISASPTYCAAKEGGETEE